MLQALCREAKAEAPADILALGFHVCMLQKGFYPVSSSTGTDSVSPDVSSSPDGSVSLKILPSGWRESSGGGALYFFNYGHPLAGAGRSFCAKALLLGENHLTVNAIENGTSGGSVLSLDLDVVKEVQTGAGEDEKLLKDFPFLALRVESAIQVRLLPALAPPQAAPSSSSKPEREGGKSQKEERERREAEMERRRRDDDDDDMGGLLGPRQPGPGPLGPFPGRGPFPDLDRPSPGFFGPDGNLIGPNHPGFGIRFPPGGRGGPPGMGPRFDPFGPVPGSLEPDNDHMRPPGTFRDGPPDGMFG
uniref:PI31 proteasome regulator N-terminal domain-containing protein n=1 Tax=Chromera velia CCMP2878 TaxID=1169474 RepID=A0A0G4HG89_9ALVE|mmetsp:Transcript_1665/g.3422  ORF Transcript_1665/g.3422 Transcript_1665/m.3422 type:complete len:304 (+) Transcript_1665:127-1038(+)|eukprot:Cvel_27167.t1-p1 / transcript=Cvel_27167.t1 / gene=Cvel_27167 / organism=Chromera_velia_CCMP2878 / gene_product=hypothetical protein / transcript_product=hypothetical protein / location=Cvel_scaffold3346:13032-16289(-) / protein_length=303 / sequence_SO=supercontig / SO=protein_coding / is_pseudo=false